MGHQFDAEIHIILDLGTSGISISYINTAILPAFQGSDFKCTGIPRWSTKNLPAPPNNLSLMEKFPACVVDDGTKIWYGFDCLDEDAPDVKFLDGMKLACQRDFKPKEGGPSKNDLMGAYKNLIAHVIDHTWGVILEDGVSKDVSVTIHYTTPGSWAADVEARNHQCNFIRSAAEKCGISATGLNVLLSLDEGSCSALVAAKELISEETAGKHYLVLDLGGLTTDICVFRSELYRNITMLKESVSRNDVGTYQVDCELMRFMMKKLGSEAIPKPIEIQKQLALSALHSEGWAQIREKSARESPMPHQIATLRTVIVNLLDNFERDYQVRLTEEDITDIFSEYVDALCEKVLVILNPLRIPLSAVYVTGGGAALNRVSTELQIRLREVGLKCTMNCEILVDQKTPRLSVNNGLQVYVQRKLKEQRNPRTDPDLRVGFQSSSWKNIKWWSKLDEEDGTRLPYLSTGYIITKNDKLTKSDIKNGTFILGRYNEISQKITKEKIFTIDINENTHIWFYQKLLLYICKREEEITVWCEAVPGGNYWEKNTGRWQGQVNVLQECNENTPVATGNREHASSTSVEK